MDSGGEPQVPWDEEGRRQEVERILECLEPSAAAQQQALERGLHLTAQALRQHSAPADMAAVLPAAAAAAAPVQQPWWRAARLQLLQQSERLGTTLVLHNG